MTKATLLSIHPKWAKLIYEGKKTIEWRKTFPFKEWHGEMKVYLYETKPVCKITGRFELLNVVETTFKEYRVIHDSLIKKGCVSLENLVKYQGAKRKIFAWILGEGSNYEEEGEQPKTLDDFGLKRPPQSWQYVEVKE